MTNTKRQIISVEDNIDGSKTVYYFGRPMGHIYPINVKNSHGMKFRAISNYDDVRHFHDERTAANFLVACV